MRITAMMVVRNPPAWKAARGSNDRPIITQKIASEPKPQARSTVANATSRICSMSPPGGRKQGPAASSCRESAGNTITSRCWEAKLRTISNCSEPEGEEIANGGQGQDGGAGQPEPERGFGGILLGPGHALVDRGRDAADNDGGGRNHQGRKHQREPDAPEQE